MQSNIYARSYLWHRISNQFLLCSVIIFLMHRAIRTSEIIVFLCVLGCSYSSCHFSLHSTSWWCVRFSSVEFGIVWRSFLFIFASSSFLSLAKLLISYAFVLYCTQNEVSHERNWLCRSWYVNIKFKKKNIVILLLVLHLVAFLCMHKWYEFAYSFFSNFFPYERIHVHFTITPHPIETWSQPIPDSFKMRKKIIPHFMISNLKTFSTVVFMKNVFLPFLFSLGESNEYEYETNHRIVFVVACFLSIHANKISDCGVINSPYVYSFQ